MWYLVGGDALARDAALVLRAGVRDDLWGGVGSSSVEVHKEGVIQ